jgi:hypothetical protein
MSDQSTPLLRTMIYISGEVFDPKDLDELLNISSTDHGIKGQEKANGKSIHRETFWKLSKDIYDYSISDAIKDILVEILPFKSKLNEYVQANQLEVSLICNVTIQEDRPLYQIENEVIQMLYSINAEFLMDIFDYSD